MFKVIRPPGAPPTFLIFRRASCWLFVPSLTQILFKIFLIHRFPYLLSHFLDFFTRKFFKFFIWALYWIIRLGYDWIRLNLTFIILIIFKGFKAFWVTIQKNVWGALGVLGDIRDRSGWHDRRVTVHSHFVILWQDIVFLIRIGSILWREDFDILFIDSTNLSCIALIMNVRILIIFYRPLQYFNSGGLLLFLRLMLLTKSSWHNLATKCLRC